MKRESNSTTETKTASESDPFTFEEFCSIVAEINKKFGIDIPCTRLHRDNTLGDVYDRYRHQIYSEMNHTKTLVNKIDYRRKSVITGKVNAYHKDIMKLKDIVMDDPNLSEFDRKSIIDVIDGLKELGTCSEDELFENLDAVLQQLFAFAQQLEVTTESGNSTEDNIWYTLSGYHDDYAKINSAKALSDQYRTKLNNLNDMLSMVTSIMDVASCNTKLVNK